MFEEREQIHGTNGEQPELATDEHRRLIGVIGRTFAFSATDARDEIYALPALAADGDQFHPLVSYTQPSHEVYCSLARRSVESGDGLQLLHHSCGKLNADGTPTWVPVCGLSSLHLETSDVKTCVWRTGQARIGTTRAFQ